MGASYVSVQGSQAEMRGVTREGLREAGRQGGPAAGQELLA